MQKLCDPGATNRDGGGPAPEDPGYADEDPGSDNSGYGDPGYGGRVEDPNRGGYDEPVPRGSERNRDSGYGGDSGY